MIKNKYVTHILSCFLAVAMIVTREGCSGSISGCCRMAERTWLLRREWL